ncbi:MAG: hypothetical protein ABIS03_12250 [Gemmatimonadaceae bacterium]
MRAAVLFPALFAAVELSAQEPTSHAVIRPTAVRTAPASGTALIPEVAQLAKGANVEVIGQDRGWVRVRVEGWVRETDIRVADTTLRALSAADLRSDPAGTRGKLVNWDVEAVALQKADQLRSGMQTGEQYLLALGPGTERSLVYLAVPESLLPTARSLPALAHISITARVRNGRSEPAGVPILDLESLTRR